MAFDNQSWKLYPEEVGRERALGIKFPLNRAGHSRPHDIHYANGSLSGTGLFVSSYTTEEQAITNLVNLVLTRKGERIMQPDYGTKVPDFVFEQNTENNRFHLQEGLKDDIANWLPYIVLGNLVVGPGSNSISGDPLHSVTISIPFRVLESGANVIVSFFVTPNGSTFEATQG